MSFILLTLLFYIREQIPSRITSLNERLLNSVKKHKMDSRVGDRIIDSQGFRLNVGIVIVNDSDDVFWGRRVKGVDSWQFPQGGINRGESPVIAMYRELNEEVGLSLHDVELLGQSRGWLRYRLPKRFVRKNEKPICIGQKQRWFLLR